jgi:hypothetical protein
MSQCDAYASNFTSLSSLSLLVILEREERGNRDKLTQGEWFKKTRKTKGNTEVHMKLEYFVCFCQVEESISLLVNHSFLILKSIYSYQDSSVTCQINGLGALVYLQIYTQINERCSL